MCQRANGRPSKALMTTQPILTTSAYTEVKHAIKMDSTSHRSEEDASHYSKILNDDNDSSEHEYANVIHKDGNDYRHKSNKRERNESQTEHYVQNECEYARVMKRPVNNIS